MCVNVSYVDSIHPLEHYNIVKTAHKLRSSLEHIRTRLTQTGMFLWVSISRVLNRRLLLDAPYLP